MGFNSGGTRRAVNGGVLAEHVAGLQVAESYGLAVGGVNADTGFALDDKEYLIGGVEVVDDRLSGRVMAPAASLLDARQLLGSKARKYCDLLQRLRTLLRGSPRHGCRSGANPKAPFRCPAGPLSNPQPSKFKTSQ
jgi:hypothetical protein